MRRRTRRAAWLEVEAQLLGVFMEQQVGQDVEVHAQLVHHREDVGAGVDQRQGHDVEVGDDRQLAEDGGDQFLEAARAHDVEIEGLVAHHDRVVALRLVDQAGELPAQRGVLAISSRTLAPCCSCMDIPFSN
jgi:hypothetical protein